MISTVSRVIVVVPAAPGSCGAPSAKVGGHHSKSKETRLQYCAACKQHGVPSIRRQKHERSAWTKIRYNIFPVSSPLEKIGSTTLWHFHAS
jgi:hypothetical protein